MIASEGVRLKRAGMLFGEAKELEICVSVALTAECVIENREGMAGIRPASPLINAEHATSPQCTETGQCNKERSNSHWSDHGWRSYGERRDARVGH